MNDQDYIRKAVELADGFENQIDDAGNYVEIDDVPYTKIYLDVPVLHDQWFFDALAAQAVRQACDDAVDFLSLMQKVAELRLETGEDFAICTIKAIVDNWVLK